MRVFWAAALVTALLAACTPPTIEEQLSTVRSSTKIVEEVNGTIKFTATASRYGEGVDREVYDEFVTTAAKQLTADGYTSLRVQGLGSQESGLYSVRGPSAQRQNTSSRTLVLFVEASKATPMPEGFDSLDQPIQAVLTYLQRERQRRGQ